MTSTVFTSLCVHALIHPPFSVSSLVEVARAVGVAMGLRGGQPAPTLRPRTVCSVEEVVSMCVHVCVHVCVGYVL